MEIDVYSKENIDKWSSDKPFQHASGIWGRKKLLQLMTDYINPDHVIVDLGCGGGYMSKLLAEKVPNGHVIGTDYKKEFVDLASHNYSDVKNLSFEVLDVKDTFPYEKKSIDNFVSFMVLQNLHSNYIDSLLGEVERCMKKDGRFFSLTLHPDIWTSNWNLEFIQYDKEKIAEWQKTHQEDLRMDGFVKNNTEGIKPLYMYTHSREKYDELFNKYKLVIDMDIPIYIDQETAEHNFGSIDGRVYPNNPVFWIFSLRKK